MRKRKKRKKKKEKEERKKKKMKKEKREKKKKILIKQSPLNVYMQNNTRLSSRNRRSGRGETKEEEK